MSDIKKDVKPVVKSETEKEKKVKPAPKVDKKEPEVKETETPYLSIYGSSIQLKAVKVNAGTLDTGKIFSYLLRHYINQWLEKNEGTELYHANHGGVDYYLDKDSSVTILTETEERGYGLYVALKDSPTENQFSIFKNSQVSLRKAPIGINLVDSYSITDSVLFNSTCVGNNEHRSYFCASELNSVILKDSFVVNSQIENVHATDSSITEARIIPSGSQYNNYITESAITRSELESSGRIQVNKATLNEVYLVLKTIYIRFRSSIETLNSVHLYADTETLDISSPYEICCIAGESMWSRATTCLFKSCDYNRRWSVVSSVIADLEGETSYHVFTFNNRASEEDIKEKLKLIVTNFKSSYRTQSLVSEVLSDLEQSILNKMAATVHGRLLVDRNNELTRLL